MLTELILTLCGVVVGVTLSEIGFMGVKNWLAQRRWRNKSPNIPEMAGCGPFGGHKLNAILQPRYWQLLERAHAKMGNAIRLFYGDMMFVSCTDLDLIKRFIVDEPDKHINRSDMSLPMDGFDEHSILMALDDNWRRLRQSTAPAFTRHKLKAPVVVDEFERTIDRCVSALGRKLASAQPDVGEPKMLVMDAEDFATRFALSLGFTCFYKQPDAVDFEAEHDWWSELVIKGYEMSVNRGAKIIATFPQLFKFVHPIIMSDFHPYGVLIKKVFEYIRIQTRNNLEARKIMGSKSPNAQQNDVDDDDHVVTLKSGHKFRRNLMDFVIDRYHEGNMTSKEYLHTSYVMLHASVKTMADGLTFMLAELARNQQVQDKLRQAILLEGSNAEYLNWFILESLRLHPPALGGCTRRIEADMYTREGLLIPKGTGLVTPAHIIHRLKEYWGDDADELRPERWADAKNFHPCQYLAFGGGRRGCLGREFAMVALRGLFNRLLRDFKFDLAPEPNQLDQFQAPYFVFIVFDKPVRVTVSPVTQ